MSDISETPAADEEQFKEPATVDEEQVEEQVKEPTTADEEQDINDAKVVGGNIVKDDILPDNSTPLFHILIINLSRADIDHEVRNNMKDGLHLLTSLLDKTRLTEDDTHIYAFWGTRLTFSTPVHVYSVKLGVKEFNLARRETREFKGARVGLAITDEGAPK